MTPAGVIFRVGPFTATSEHEVHALLMHYSALDGVNNNTHHLKDADFPVGRSIVTFGAHRIYVAVLPNEYPAKVLRCDELPSSDNGDLLPTSTNSTPTWR
ncbi:hypothetical protein D1007_42699 [Hordeum vulgare]|nr:hypothetical protein D1007_42699 [Hordeum vulgare]